MIDFKDILPIRAKRLWWLDVLFYFAVALLLALVFSYLAFLVKNNMQSKSIQEQVEALHTVGTRLQKEHEQVALDYQSKISDFARILSNHNFASNVFAFMQAQTMPNVWFKQFGLDNKNSSIQLTGESENLDALSRQVAVFENNKYVKSFGALNSSAGTESRIQFSMNLSLDEKIFDYLADVSLVSAVTASDQSLLENNEENSELGKSSEKEITSFKLLTNPQIEGVISQTEKTIVLSVPVGMSLTSVSTFITASPKASIVPTSGTPQDFSNSVTYVVTAEDGSIQNYEVRIIPSIMPGLPVQQVKNSGFNQIWIFVILFAVLVFVGLIVFIIIKKKKKSNEYAS